MRRGRVPAASLVFPLVLVVVLSILLSLVPGCLDGSPGPGDDGDRCDPYGPDRLAVTWRLDR